MNFLRSLPWPQILQWGSYVLTALLAGLLAWLLARKKSKTGGLGDQSQSGTSLAGERDNRQGAGASAGSDTETGNQGSNDREKLVAKILRADSNIGRHLLSKSGAGESIQGVLADPKLIRRVAKQLNEEDLEMFRIAALQVDVKFDLQSTRHRKEVRYPTSDIEPVRLSDYGDLALALPEQLLQPRSALISSLVNGDLTRMANYESELGIKLMYLLVDISPSMEFGMANGLPRHLWSRGIVVSLLQQARRGEAEFFYRSFGNDVTQLVRVKTPAQAEALMAKIFEGFAPSGGTDIANALECAIKDIRTQATGVKLSEILLITDAMDSTIEIDHMRRLLGTDIRLHVVVLGKYDSRDGNTSESRELRQIAATYRKIE